MKSIRTIACWAGIGLALQLSAQHTPITTQYLFNGLLINPAYAGSRDALTANLTWRQQWMGFEGAPRTQVLSIHSPLTGKRSALGLLATNDRIGVARETGVMLDYAYRVKLGRGELSFGMGVGVKMQHYEWSAVQTTDPGDAQFASDGPNLTRPDLSGGLYWASKKYFVGLSMPTLPRTIHLVDSTAERSPSWLGGQPMFTAGMLVRASRDIKLKPSILLRQISGEPVQGDLNINVIWRERLWVGASWRKDDALCFLLEVLPTPQLRFGYSYDLGLGPMARYHQGSHELMFQYEFGFHVKAHDPRYF